MPSHRSRRLLLLAALPLLLAACSTRPDILEVDPDDERLAPYAERASFAEAPEWKPILGPGDVIRVNVFDHPQLSSPPWESGVNASPIEGSGLVQLPLVGGVHVAGLSPLEASERIEEALSEYLKEPRVDVAVIEFGSQRVFVFGSVELPGVFPLERPTSVGEVLFQFAQGPDQLANREDVLWLRVGFEDPEEAAVFINAEEMDLLLTARVSPGDLIYVGRRDWADVGEAARDLIPLLQSVAIPLSLGLQVATLERIR